jgi:hypothetical protein
MKGQKWREIVIEVERTQIVRKKTQTHLMFCRNCGREVDSESLPEAAALFTANAENLLKFVRVSRSHFETGADGEIYLCFVSFLASMKAKPMLLKQNRRLNLMFYAETHEVNLYKCYK